jgi:hypothetical protein
MSAILKDEEFVAVEAAVKAGVAPQPVRRRQPGNSALAMSCQILMRIDPRLCVEKSGCARGESG